MTEIIAKHHSPRELGDLIRAAIERGSLCEDPTCPRCVAYRSVLEEEAYDAQWTEARLLDAMLADAHVEPDDEEPCCDATHPDAWYMCTLNEGHEGRHEAAGSEVAGDGLATWVAGGPIVFDTSVPAPSSVAELIKSLGGEL